MPTLRDEKERLTSEIGVIEELLKEYGEDESVVLPSPLNVHTWAYYFKDGTIIVTN